MLTVQNSDLLWQDLPTGALETQSGRTQEAVQINAQTGHKRRTGKVERERKAVEREKKERNAL